MKWWWLIVLLILAPLAYFFLPAFVFVGSLFIFTDMTTDALHFIQVILALPIWALLLGSTCGLFTRKTKGWQRIVGLLCLATFLLAWGGYHIHDSGWRGRLLDASDTLRRQIITLPPDASTRSGDAYLVLEIGDGAKVAVDDQASSAYELSGTRIENELIPWEVALGVPLDGGQYDTLLTLGADTVSDFPHYVAWPVPPNLLAGEQIVVTVEGAVWDDTLPDESGVSIIPSPRRWDDARSMFLAIWGKGDRRIPTRYEWDGVEYISEFHGGGWAYEGWTSGGSWGMPSSVYRIYLVWDTGPIREP